MKIWDKGTPLDQLIEEFTAGKDRELDLQLAEYDIIGSLAHITMLEKVGLLSAEELTQLRRELLNILGEVQNDTFEIAPGVEDVHSQIELLLTERIGAAGKKIHSARSRNDQVLLDLKLFTRARLESIVQQVSELFTKLQSLSESSKGVLIPGYTHLQVAMPSSFGLWFGAYAEILGDDLQMLLAAYKITNQNPLGAAAGYGSSFPIDRQLTTKLLGFDDLNYNVVYAQMGRGKMERTVAFTLATVAATMGKMAADLCLFNSPNFGFITLPDELTTGSSIMPHKKNPDVFELLRANCGKLQGLPNEIALVTNNLTSGYFRDYQILKESYLPAFGRLVTCLQIFTYVIDKIELQTDILEQDIYQHLFSVEEVNKLVLNGVPFREAYRQVADSIADGTYRPDKTIKHTHAGSIGNLCTAEIKTKFDRIYQQYDFEEYRQAIDSLLKL